MIPDMSASRSGASDTELEKIGEIVYNGAEEVFELCGVSHDFCIQSVGFEAVVFGGSNRVIWTLTQGFRPDKRYCSQSFIDKFNLIKKTQ